MDKLTVSIVNYNAGEFLIQCLESLEVLDELKFKVFVVDNASTDGSIAEAKKKFPKVNFILNKKNVGFGRAHNQVLKNLTTEFVLILNPDTKLIAGTLKTMVEFMSDKSIGASSCKVVKEDGSLDWASHRGFPTPWASFLYFFLKNDSLYHMRNADMTKPHEVDAIVGAFILTRKEVLDRVGLFDEDYFLYAEDLDLCFRIKENGLKIMYNPNAYVVHLKGVTSGIKKHSQQITSATVESKLKAFNSFYETMIIFYKKHLEKNYPFFINWLVIVGIKLKWWLDGRKLMV